MRYSEEQLQRYALPLSDTENQKCLNAISMVRDALGNLGFSDCGNGIELLYENSSAYSLKMQSQNGNRKIKLLIQGSYANNTNVRTQSDVDIAVIEEDRFSDVYRPGLSKFDYNFVDAQQRNTTFKDEVVFVLYKYFNTDVIRKNKSIKISGNSYRKNVDVVPCLRHRDYTNDFNYDPNNYLGGIQIIADDGSKIVNYPEQHIKNGKEKNIATNHFYKKTVRIMKKVCCDMRDGNFVSAQAVSSFGIESLLWNIPNSTFLKQSNLLDTFNSTIDYLLSGASEFSSYREANGIKFLHENHSVYDYITFVKDLKRFYEL